MRYSRIIGIALGVFAFAAPAMAEPIIYTEKGTGSGILDGTPFTDQLVTITMAEDTSNIEERPSGMMQLGLFTNPGFEQPGSATVAVAGAGTDTLRNIVAFVHPGIVPEAGFTGTMFTIVVEVPSWGTFSQGFRGYELGPIGPTSGTANITGNGTFTTGSGGTFTLTNVVGPSTFEANLVPLPAALPLLATGLGALGLLGWRRKRKSRVSLLGAA